MDFTSRILIVDDDEGIRTLMSEFLGKHGFATATASDPLVMRKLLAEQSFDLIVLDVMMPREDGLTALKSLGPKAPPVIMLSAVGSDIDRIVGLEMGADDHLGKPFEPRELLARIRALFRRIDAERAVGTEGRRLVFAGLVLDIDARTLETAGGAAIPLTGAEFDLLVCLAERPGRVLSRDQLLDWTRGRIADPLDRTIDVSISRLRRKLDEAGIEAEKLIATVRNGGYQFSAKVTRA